MKTKYRIKSWETMVDVFGVNQSGFIDCEHNFTEDMKTLCGATCEKDCRDIGTWRISHDMIEEYIEYEVGDAIKVQNGEGPIFDRYYAGMIDDRVLTVEYPDEAFSLLEGVDWECCRIYDRIVEEPKEEYLDFSKAEDRFFVNRKGEVFQSTSLFSEEGVKNLYNAEVRLLVSIDPETGKAVTKSLKIGEE